MIDPVFILKLPPGPGKIIVCVAERKDVKWVADMYLWDNRTIKIQELDPIIKSEFSEYLRLNSYPPSGHGGIK